MFGKEIQLQIAKIGWKYQVIDKTFPLKNPIVWFDDFDTEKMLDSAVQYIKSKYQNCKIILGLESISDMEKKIIESELQALL